MIQVYKSSKVTLLRPQLLSLTLGGVWAFFVFVLTLVAMASGTSSGLIELFEVIYPGYRVNFLGSLIGLVWGFVNGYLLGYMIGWIYDWLAKQAVQGVQDTLFALDFNKKVNIIRPVPAGGGAALTGRTYNIAIVANPEILNTTEESTQPDPIIDQELFTKAVVRIIRSFINNEVLRLPEILERIRFFVVFNDDPSSGPAGLNDPRALCKEFKPFPVIIMEPRPTPMTNFVRHCLNLEGISDGVDVILAVTASNTHTRSAALFGQDTAKASFRQGDGRFVLTMNNGTTIQGIHTCDNTAPGVVALSVWDDRLKTPVHEFAHAMSSRENGVLVDEYLDEYEDNGNRVSLPNVINKQHRASPHEEIPKLFGRYELFEHNGSDFQSRYTIEYLSDRDRADKRPSEEEPAGWTSYVPARKEVSLSCVMDIAYWGYRFDDLIFDFIYDRILGKLNRP